jgi:hypothetical protein
MFIYNPRPPGADRIDAIGAGVEADPAVVAMGVNGDPVF